MKLLGCLFFCSLVHNLSLGRAEFLYHKFGRILEWWPRVGSVATGSSHDSPLREKDKNNKLQYFPL